MVNRVHIAIFASGGGSNAEQLIQHFSTVSHSSIDLVVSNNSEAYVLERAKKHQIPTYVHSKEDAENGQLLELLKEKKIDFIVLAGYLKKIGDDLLNSFSNKIVNIHPALLPKYGGKGMYGMNVHKAVVAAKETESGPTIHFVNENYDEGAIIEQHKCDILPSDSAEDVQKKVLKLEHAYFAKSVERIIKESYGI